MHLYTRLNKNLQEKIDFYIKKINKKTYKDKINNELNKFNCFKMICIYLEYYNNYTNKYPKLCLGFDIMLNDIFFWLNHPYSQQLDTPFMSGNITERCKKIIKTLNPNIDITIPFDDYGIYLNCNILKYFLNKKYNSKLDTKYISMNILNILSYNELEDLYIYTTNQIINKPNKNIINIPLKFNKKFYIT